MPAPRILVGSDIAAFCDFRRAALIESPWAFLASPDDDLGCDPGLLAAKLAEHENDILAVFEEGDAGRILAAAGVFRQKRLKTRHRAVIWGVYCRPAVRGQGHGRAVTRAAIETARSWSGVDLIGLSVSRRAEAAIALYRSLGFEPWGTEPDAMRADGQRHDETHMILRLK